MQHQEPKPTTDPVLAPTAAIALVVADAVAALLDDKPIEAHERERRLTSIRHMSSELLKAVEAIQPGITEGLPSKLPALFPDDDEQAG